MTDLRDSDEPYIFVTTEQDGQDVTKVSLQASDPLYIPWGEQCAKWPEQVGFGVRRLREIYPNHSVLAFSRINVISFAGASAHPISPPEMVNELTFRPLTREQGESTGVLVDAVRFGAFKVTWRARSELPYTDSYLRSVLRGERSVQFLVYNGSETPIRELLIAAGKWSNDLHQEIYVFDGGYWAKNHKLWLEVQKADWDDVILKEEFKTQLQIDILGFFDSRDLYKSLAIPWKRGIIMHGPPGNGKTISMKAVMKDCDAKGYYPLYVKSFRSFKGEEGALVDIFQKAREVSPCVMIFEDLDSLINAKNRSFFLNQLDGLESNDGLLIIGTTNHLELIDPALRSRPSRFDRKFEFDDPTPEERKLYVQYWQNKLRPNKSISFPDDLVDEIVKMTDTFSFAYLKEIFVSTLVILAGYGDKNRPAFATVLKNQIKTLKEQLGKKPRVVSTLSHSHDSVSPGFLSYAGPSPSSACDIPGPRLWDIDTSHALGYMTSDRNLGSYTVAEGL